MVVAHDLIFNHSSSSSPSSSVASEEKGKGVAWQPHSDNACAKVCSARMFHAITTPCYAAMLRVRVLPISRTATTSRATKKNGSNGVVSHMDDNGMSGRRGDVTWQIIVRIA